MSNIYRTRTCGDLSNGNIGESVKLSGWVDTKRDHGGVLFIDLRDNYGKIQIVADEERCKISNLDELAKVHNESVICVDGKVVERSDETKNPKIKNGDIEVLISKFEILSSAEVLPFQVNEEDGTNEEVRLKYRFLELRKEKLHNTIIFRAKVFAYIRQRMAEAGFYEYQTPILTASSPEGARDFLVPSRLHKGQFYALPQAPQQFKQLLMISGFDKYFQIAPCFRDEDPRADRSPGEFYQLDMEMSFVEQEDIFQTMEPVAKDIFNKFKGENDVICDEIRRIKFKDAMLKYGSDKPDLRIPIENVDATEPFVGSDFKAFAGAIEKGCVVRGTPVNNIGQRSRSFYDGMVEFAIKQGAKGLGYIIFENGEAKGPVAKFLSKDRLEKIHNKMILNDNGIIPNNLISYSKLFKNSCELEWGKDVSVGVASRVCGKIANECLKQNLDSLTIFVFNQQTCICGESVIGPYKEICDKKNNRWKYLFFDNNDCNLNNSIIEKNILTHISCQKTKKQVLLDVENGKYDIVLQNLQQSFNNSKEDLYAYNCCKFIINSIKSHSFDKIDAIFFSCDKEENANKFAGLARKELGARLNLIDKNRYELCWIIDFPFYEWNEDEKKIDFSHNPFSKPKCDVETLKKASKDELLCIEANQYDLVCNGYELASGAIRNSNIDMMYEAFKIAGYSKEDVDSKFGGMRKAFNYGAPPHGGMAIGIERLIMLLLKTDNIRDVIAFPLNGRAEDLLMNAPSDVSAQQLKDLGIKVVED